MQEIILNYTSFLLQLIYIILPSFVVYAVIRKVLNDSLNINDKYLQIALSLAIGPSFTSILYYYMYLIVPDQADFVYSTVFVTLILGMYFTINYKYKSKTLITEKENNGISKFEIVLFSGSLLYLSFSVYSLEYMDLMKHDMYEYAVFSKMIAKNKLIEYSKFRYYEDTGFYYVGLHGFSFPILCSLSHSLTDMIGYGKDYLLRFLSHYYSLLLIFTSYLMFKQITTTKAIVVVLLLCTSVSIGILSYFLHLDTYRLTIMLISSIIWYLLLKKDNIKLFNLAFVLLALSSFIHSINFIVAVIQISLLIWNNIHNIKERFVVYLKAIILFLIFGGIHYLIDIVWGTGWIIG